jgi:hypothetical protein
MATEISHVRANGHPATRAGDHSVGELVKQASEQMSVLVRQELRLAQTELTEKGKRAGIGGGLFGGAGITALIAVLAGVAAAIAAFALILPGWAACLVVMGALFLAAGLMALVGRAQLRKATPAAPQQAMESVRTDIHEIKESAHR